MGLFLFFSSWGTSGFGATESYGQWFSAFDLGFCFHQSDGSTFINSRSYCCHLCMANLAVTRGFLDGSDKWSVHFWFSFIVYSEFYELVITLNRISHGYTRVGVCRNCVLRQLIIYIWKEWFVGAARFVGPCWAIYSLLVIKRREFGWVWDRLPGRVVSGAISAICFH